MIMSITWITLHSNEDQTHDPLANQSGYQPIRQSSSTVTLSMFEIIFLLYNFMTRKQFLMTLKLLWGLLSELEFTPLALSQMS